MPREEHSAELGALHIYEVPITKHLLSATYYSCDPGRVSLLTCKMGWMVTLAHPSQNTPQPEEQTAETGNNLDELKEIMLIKQPIEKKIIDCDSVT